jgi:hypothetical protein
MQQPVVTTYTRDWGTTRRARHSKRAQGKFQHSTKRSAGCYRHTDAAHLGPEKSNMKKQGSSHCFSQHHLRRCWNSSYQHEEHLQGHCLVLVLPLGLFRRKSFLTRQFMQQGTRVSTLRSPTISPTECTASCTKFVAHKQSNRIAMPAVTSYKSYASEAFSFVRNAS